jgi:hypothetical protein
MAQQLMLDLVLNSELEEQLDVIKLQAHSNEIAAKVTDETEDTYENAKAELKKLCTVELKR